MKHWSYKICLVIAVLFGSSGYASQGQAQDNVWLQIDAQKSKATAENSAQHYDDFLPDVAGFSIISGWYVIAVGPYSELKAQTLLQTYRNARQIPNDSFINYAEDYVHQFWPFSTETSPPNLLKSAFTKLPKDQRKTLQDNLKELGYYNSNIDGLYGRGTSGALTAYNKEQLGNSDLKVSINVSALVEAVLALNDAEGISPENPIVEAPIVAEVVPEVEVAEEEPEVEIPEDYQAGIEAYNSGDFQTAMEQAKFLAPLGNADAQFYLGKMYAEGKGTLQRNTHAHMWFNLASANGHSEAAQEPDVLAGKMTPVLVDKAQDLAAACMDSDYQDCALGKKPKSNNQDTNNIKYTENDKAVIKVSFREETLLRRKQIQYALRRLGYYTSSVDGLWGKGTERAIINYGQDEKLGPNNTSELFASALSKVDVPSSFAVAQPKKKPAVTRRQPSQNSYGLTALISSPSLPADQAMAVCRPQATAAKSQAKRSHRPSNTTFSGSCRQDYFGNYNCTGGNSLSGGKWGGVLSAFESVNAGKKAYEAVLQSCLAGYGWRD